MEFPQELVDYIIDFLHDSLSSLRACSLTCRAWAESSQHHLLKSIRLRSPVRCKELISMIDDHPGLGHHIRRLSLRYHLKGDHDQLFDDLFDLTSRLSNVRRLYPALTHVFDDSLTEKLIASIAPISSIITHLDTAYMRFETAEQFVKLVSCMPSLERLSFGANIKNKSLPSPTASLPPPIPPKLTELKLFSQPSPNPPLHWFRLLASQIFSLNLRVHGRDLCMSEICKLFGPSITLLDFFLSGSIQTVTI
jgi:hypothetical protein